MTAMVYSKGIIMKFGEDVEDFIRKKRSEFGCDSFENSQNQPMVYTIYRFLMRLSTTDCLNHVTPRQTVELSKLFLMKRNINIYYIELKLEIGKVGR